MVAVNVKDRYERLANNYETSMGQGSNVAFVRNNSSMHYEYLCIRSIKRSITFPTSIP